MGGGGVLPKVVRLCPGLLSPALLVEKGRREDGGGERGMGEGADTVPLGTFSPSLSFSPSFFSFLTVYTL